MKVTSVTGASDSYGNATLVAMSGAIRSALTSYRNVTFVERYSIDEDRCRDVYAIGGINNLYLTIENEAINPYIVVRVYLKNNVHTNNYIDTITLQLDGELLGEKSYLFDNKMYTFSENGRLYCLMFSTKDSTPTDYIGIDSEYLYINDSACKDDDSYGTKQYVNASIPNITYAEAEKVLKTRPLITADNIESATAFYSISGILYKMINSAFSTMNFSLIQVGDTKYRQVYADYLFVKNGDNE